MEENEYQLILRLSFKALDDPSARQKAKEYLKNSGLSEKVITKLQKVNKNSPPEGIKL